MANGLEKGIFYKKEDGSVWIDLTDEGLDEKIVLRADGTAVYMTQDIGTAIQRIKDFPDIPIIDSPRVIEGNRNNASIRLSLDSWCLQHIFF